MSSEEREGRGLRVLELLKLENSSLLWHRSILKPTLRKQSKVKPAAESTVSCKEEKFPIGKTEAKNKKCL